MIKRGFQNWKKYMVRPAVYKGIVKFMTALVIVLLWDRFLNQGGRMMLWDAFFVAGAFFAAMAWFDYLKLDGVEFLNVQRVEDEKKQTRHVQNNMADYVDQHIVAWEELSEEERRICSFVSDLLLAVLFFLPAAVKIFL